MRELLVDGDALAFRACAASQHTSQWDDCTQTIAVDAAEALHSVLTTIEELKLHTAADAVRVFFSGPRSRSFRRKLYPEYKANRDGKPPQLGLSTLMRMLEGAFPCEREERLEADDLIGIAATTPDGVERIVVGNDKDFLAVPCRYINYIRLEDGIHETTEAQADRQHLTQTLTGDACDGYGGCPGVGPKRAEAIVDGGWPAVVAAYTGRGLTEADALLNARMARILRYGDYDRKRQKVTLWKPKA